MGLKQLLSEFELVNGIYLRKDQQAVAVVSPDERRIGFLTIKPESRLRFKGTGLVIDDAAFQRGNFTASTFTHPSEQNGLLKVTPEQIEEFANKSEIDPNNVPDYLNKFSEVPCQDYAVDTLANKIRTAIATATLRYSPLRYSQRRRMREQLERQIPPLVEKMCRLLDQTQQFADTTLAGRVAEYEKLLGRPLREFVGQSREELHSLLDRKLIGRAKYTKIRNKAEYWIENVIDACLQEGYQRFVYNHHTKLNC